MKELLEEFADECNKTSGASFTIYRKQDKTWVVRLVNKADGVFEGLSLEVLLMKATKYLIENRKSKGETFTL